MVSLSVGHYGALRYRYADMKALDGNNRLTEYNDAQSPASDTRYQIHTPWIIRAGAPSSELQPEDRLQSQFTLPMMRRDVAKNHQYEIGWETNIYDPLDQRTRNVPSKPKAVAPIPCISAAHATTFPNPNFLYSTRNPPTRYSTAMALRSPPFISTPSTRSEEWSTLRQMLPSRGPVLMKKSCENWGTGEDYVPQYATNETEVAKAMQRQSFPRINSAMSRYAHEAYFHDNLFKMF